MHELHAHPEDSAAIVRNALDAAGPLAEAFKLDWKPSTRDCVTLADARAGLLEVWDLLVRADTRFLRDCGERGRPGRDAGYAPFIAAVADARALLAPLADGGRERATVRHFHDPWRTTREPEPPQADRRDPSGALARAVERAVTAAGEGNPDDEAFRDLLTRLRSAPPGKSGGDPDEVALLGARRWVYATLQAMFPDAETGGQREQAGPAHPDARRWMAARRALVCAGAVAPDTPGFGGVRRAIERPAHAECDGDVGTLATDLHSRGTRTDARGALRRRFGGWRSLAGHGERGMPA